MKTPLWAKAIKTSADPQRAKHFAELLAGTTAVAAMERFSADQIRVIVALFSGSQTLSELLVANPDWLAALDIERIRYPRREQGFRKEVQGLVKPLLTEHNYHGALAEPRRFKQREMLRIAARDLARLADVVEITREISDVADVCLDTVWQICRQQFTERFGQPYHQDTDGRWQPTASCVLGMGKLGGQELNYSSDVDVLFVYSDEGQVFREAPGKKLPRSTMTSHTFFNRLAESYITEVARMTPEGVLFRIDLRLRPEGDAGPLCRSLESYENYYAQWGQTWERMMLIKARRVAGDEGLASEFIEMIQPFRFPRSISESVLREVAAIKDRIENEVVGADELDRNVKLGRGGIREIEFIAQVQQLLHAGRQPFLQGAQTLPCLAKLVEYRLLTEPESRQLGAAYRFLRDVEHRLQMEANLQTHTIPSDRDAQERLAKLMGFRSKKEFESALRQHTDNVRRAYDRLLKAETPVPKSKFPAAFEGCEAEWKKILTAHSFRDPDKAFRVLKEFVEGPGFVHVSPRTVELARQLLLTLLELCPKPKADIGGQRPAAGPRSADAQQSVSELRVLSDPDRVVTRLDSFLSAYGARGALYEMWTGNPSLFELLLLLFDRSEFLAEAMIRSPELFDELVSSDRLRQRKTAPEILTNLHHGLKDPDQFFWLRRYHEAELMRLGLRDILGLADFEQNLTELSALADACLQYALEVVMRKHRLKSPPFVIVGFGKLGGREIDYGSDLDVVFVTDAKVKSLAKLQGLAVEVKNLLSQRTDKGMVFHVDARLRPDGEKGLLVNILPAYEEYYQQRAQLWEIQALTRVRPVAGDLKLGQTFQELAARLTDFSKVGQASSLSRQKQDRLEARPTLPTCAMPDWKHKIHAMRMRIEKERTPVGKDALAIKTGKGGLMDAEFIAQTLCLEHGWQVAHTLRALERARDAKVLPDADKLLANYRQLRRVEGILRRWSYEGETVLPDDPAPYYRVSVRCGFATPEAFRAALAQWRSAIREVYKKVFNIR
jgi:[glutamine synthetase] adenylyltransferase / [glutamine synthetase]-adenylyl-L-tyrosine phosphorylase